MVVKRVIFTIFIFGMITIFASELDVKNAISNYFQDKNTIFLYIKKMNNGNYFVIARHKNEQDRIVVDNNGKILSIADDLLPHQLNTQIFDAVISFIIKADFCRTSHS